MINKQNISLATVGVIASLLFLLCGASIFITSRVENKIEELLADKATYEEIEVNLWLGQIIIKDLAFRDGEGHLYTNKMVIQGFEYLDYFFNDRIIVDDLTLKNPEISLNQNQSKTSFFSGQTKRFSQEILIRNFKASSGTLKIPQGTGTNIKNKLFVSFPEIIIREVRIDSTTVNKPIPFAFSSYKISADSLRLHMNPEHFITANEVRWDSSTLRMMDFRIIPYYTKLEFDQNVDHEMDRIALSVDSIKLKNPDLAFLHDSLYLKSPLMTIGNVDLQIYRNRLLPDTAYKKPLYNELIRTLPIKIDLEKISISDSRVVYEEKLKRAADPAKIGFYGIGGEIENLTNINLDRRDFPKTTIQLNASFEKVVPVKIFMSFDISNTADEFLFKGDVGTVPAEALNEFLRPAMNVKATGKLQSVSITFSGDPNSAIGDVKVKYNQFKVQLLKENGEKKDVISAIANLFIDNDGLSEDAVQENIRVFRDPTKSFWSFVWSALRKGLRQGLSQI